MKWRVRWLRTPLGDLASIWMASSDRAAVTAAAAEIDRLLGLDPEQQGESRPGGRRIMFEMPLGVFFRVFPDQSLVEVVHVWKTKKRTK